MELLYLLFTFAMGQINSFQYCKRTSLLMMAKTGFLCLSWGRRQMIRPVLWRGNAAGQSHSFASSEKHFSQAGIPAEYGRWRLWGILLNQPLLTSGNKKQLKGNIEYVLTRTDKTSWPSAAHGWLSCTNCSLVSTAYFQFLILRYCWHCLHV